MLYYILQVVLLQLIFLLFYDLFLRKESYFQWNRFYLLGTGILSFMIPLMRFGFTQESSWQEQLQPVIIGGKQLETQISTNISATNTNYLLWIYLSGVVIFFLLFAYKLWRIGRMIYQAKSINKDGYTLVLLSGEAEAFSFYKYIFIQEDLVSDTDIVQHEMVHLSQKHWLDLLLFELLKIVFWFNPVLSMLQNRLSLIHEYIADKAVLQQTDIKSYFNRLIGAHFSVRNIAFVNQIYKPSQIKKRILMQKRKTSKTNLMIKSAGFTLLLMAVLVLLDACNTQSRTDEKTSNTEQVKAVDTSTVNKVKITQIKVDEANDADDVEVAFQFIKTPPVFPGCENAKDKKACMSKKIQEFVGNNFNTALAEELKLEGEKVKIMTMFTIDKTGKVSKIKARAKYKPMEEEAKRVIGLLPKMKPGIQKDKPVKVTYTLPIVFKVEE